MEPLLLSNALFTGQPLSTRLCNGYWTDVVGAGRRYGVGGGGVVGASSLVMVPTTAPVVPMV